MSDPLNRLDCNPPPSSKSLFTDPEALEGRMTKATTIILLIIAIMTITINLGVMVRVYKLIRKGGDVKPAFFLIGNLAVSDLLIGLYIVVIFCIDLTQLSAEWRNNCCFLLTAFVVTACEETICTITLIAIDKYIFICHGISYRSIVRKKRIWISIFLTWLFSLLIGFLPAFGLHEENWCACNFTLYVNTQFALVLFVTSVIVPLAIIVTLYSIILTIAIQVTKKKLEKEKSRGIASVLRLSLKIKTSKSSSSNTVSTKLSSSGASSSSHLSSSVSKISNQSYKENLSNKRINTDEFKQLTNIVSAKATRSNAAALPTVVELHEVDLMPYEMDSSSDDEDGVEREEDESENEEEEDTSEDGMEREEKYSKNRGGGETNNRSNEINYLKKKTGRYELDSPKKTLRNNESQSQVYLQSYNQTTDESSSYTNYEKNKSNKTNKIQEEEDEAEITENNSLTANDENTRNSKIENGNRLKRKRSYFKKIYSESKDKVLFLQKCRAIKPIILILLCFTITYVPFVTCNLVFKLQDDKSEHLFKALNNLLYFAVVINSLINPFVYAYGYKEFRLKTKNFKGIFAKEKRTKHSTRK